MGPLVAARARPRGPSRRRRGVALAGRSGRGDFAAPDPSPGGGQRWPGPLLERLAARGADADRQRRDPGQGEEARGRASQGRVGALGPGEELARGAVEGDPPAATIATTRSAAARQRSSRCSASRTATPHSSLSRRSSQISSSPATGSSCEVGSSSSTSRGPGHQRRRQRHPLQLAAGEGVDGAAQQVRDRQRQRHLLDRPGAVGRRRRRASPAAARSPPRRWSRRPGSPGPGRRSRPRPAARPGRRRSRRSRPPRPSPRSRRRGSAEPGRRPRFSSVDLPEAERPASRTNSPGGDLEGDAGERRAGGLADRRR